MDVFSAVTEGASRAHLRAAAVQAAAELGLFELLAQGEARSAGQLALQLGLRRDHRVQALLDVLALEGILAVERGAPRAAPGLTAGAAPARSQPEALAGPAPARFSLLARPAPASPLPPLGWGRLAEVLRRDRPLEEPGVRGEQGAPGEPRGDSLRRFHSHLLRAGAEAAAELMAPLARSEGGRLLDLGSGAGAYARAWLAARGDVRAVLFDRPEVLALAGGDCGGALEAEACEDNYLLRSPRAELRPGELFDEAPWPRAEVVLLANLLHLFGPEAAQRLVGRAAAAVAPGGLVVVKDLWLEPERTGPAAGVLFSLNMALFTEEGRVHARDALLGFLERAGLVELELRPLSSAPDALVAQGRRPRGGPGAPR